MADLYGVASMTAQRALRELQNRRITYSVAGKGTFVHPDAFDLLRGAVLQEPIADPELRGRVAAYLTDQQAITRRFHAARTADDRNAAINDLLRHADAHDQLIDEVIRYHADHGNFAKQPAHLIRDDDPGPATRGADRRAAGRQEDTSPPQADDLTACSAGPKLLHVIKNGPAQAGPQARATTYGRARTPSAPSRPKEPELSVSHVARSPMPTAHEAASTDGINGRRLSPEW